MFKVKLELLIAAAFVLFLTSLAHAQNAQEPASQTQTETRAEADKADVSITANVTARELRFEVVPNPTVTFNGNPERKTTWDALRQNLPRPVQPFVTYRNIGIQLKITSVFADIDRIVAEALGEVPVTDNIPPAPPPPNSQPSTPADKNSSPAPAAKGRP
ncbi:MAG: hypothetical protein JOZ52_05865 [Acidobacteria bacterium]|nr:hypothetical protein [Acidobacteriota bacterium]